MQTILETMRDVSLICASLAFIGFVISLRKKL
jgi:hypothetical protein